MPAIQQKARPSGSVAVMNQRIEPLDSLDDFPTPPWATRALIERVLKPRGLYHREQLVWEPACGRGIMSAVLREFYPRTVTSDIAPDKYPDYRDHTLPFREDFLNPEWPDSEIACDWIITNPPFRLGCEFALQALNFARFGVAMFCRANWIEGRDRYHRLFYQHPLSLIGQFVERVPLVRGKHEHDELGGIDFDASTATSYAWFIWLKVPQFRDVTVHTHIPPDQRTLLERPHDRRRFGKQRHAPLIIEPPVLSALEPLA
jgi:hypothetical protein